MSIVSRDSASSSLLGISGFNSERILDEKVEILISKTRNFVRSLITRSTILSLLPLLLWWLIFQLNIYVPFHLRPTIHIRLLPWLEETFFGVPVYRLFPHIEATTFFDLLAAAAYGVHFIAPWSYCFYLWRTSKRQLAFLCSLGILNALAVVTQFFIPTSPPWYIEQYGYKEASYVVKGEAAGLEYADEIMGVEFFRTIYSSSPVVFGSWPSLHAAWPVLIAWFGNFQTVFGKLLWVYAATVWWAALYLQHHYLVDLIGGALYVYFAVQLAMRLVPENFAPLPESHEALSKKQDVPDEIPV